MTTIGSAHRFNDLPSFRVDYDVDAINWVVRKQNGISQNHIKCFRCLGHIENIDNVVTTAEVAGDWTARTESSNHPTMIYLTIRPCGSRTKQGGRVLAITTYMIYHMS